MLNDERKRFLNRDLNASTNSWHCFELPLNGIFEYSV